MNPTIIEIRSTECSHYGHPEFRVTWTSSAVPHGDAALLVKHLEERVSAGERFRAGETLQIGWIEARLRLGPIGLLEFEEPDFLGCRFLGNTVWIGVFSTLVDKQMSSIV